MSKTDSDELNESIEKWKDVLAKVEEEVKKEKNESIDSQMLHRNTFLSSSSDNLFQFKKQIKKRKAAIEKIEETSNSIEMDVLSTPKTPPSFNKKESSIESFKQTWLFDEDLEEEDDIGCLINPDSRFKNIWDIFILIILVALLIFLPIRLAFEPIAYEKLTIDQVHIIDILIDIFFFIDIIINFLTFYIDKFGVKITDRKKIAKRYIKSWFLLDVISTFPFHLIINDRSSSFSSLAKLPRLIKLVRLLRFLKLLKAYRLKELMQAIEFSRHIRPSF